MNVKVTSLRQERARLFLERSYHDLCIEEVPFTATYAPSEEPVAPEDAAKLEYRPIKEGEVWGKLWHSAWFRLSADVPESWRGRDLAMHVSIGGEAMLFDGDMVPVYAFTITSIFQENYTKEFYQMGKAAGGERISCMLEGACNHLFGAFMDPDPGEHTPDPYGTINPTVKYLRLAVFNTELWHLRIEVMCVLSLADALPAGDYRREKMIMALAEAMDVYAGDPGNSSRAREALKPVLAFRAMDSAPTTTAVGHAHIDVGWLWPVRETIRKTARTYASQLELMDRYPDYVFGGSQPQIYDFVKKHYPKLYEKVRRRVAEGRWEPQGGMWVEADCNIISGESMVRQFLCGKNFFKDEFGFEVKNLWLPDVFGYSAAMPQIMKKSGCDYFLTQKISWSQFNRFPYHTFFWKGIDGTEVLTHFLPEDTYNSALLPKDLYAAQNRNNESGFVDEFLTVFGIGDGGGGPSDLYVESGMISADWESVPRVRFGRSDEFFKRIDEKYSSRVPRWVGELYLELHRGTLTTQSRTKRGNRKLEQKLAETEFICSMLKPEDYPSAELDEIWKIVLINQFHDIIPGSSITMVYRNTEREHAECMRRCEKLIEAAEARLFRRAADSMLFINTLSRPWTNPLVLPDDWADTLITDADGAAVPVQIDAEGRMLAIAVVPASGWIELHKGAAAPTPRAEKRDALVLENTLVRYEFNRDAVLIKAYDKELQREILTGDGNVLTLYHDRPNNYDAWDIDIFYDGEVSGHPESVVEPAAAAGAVSSSIIFKMKVGENSSLTQCVRLAANSKRLDFATEADWHESRRMLRVAFPVNVFSDEAAFDIQYGTVKRPTHDNTSWDIARFEVAGQRFVDMSEHDYGVALLNDCKYGHKVKGSVLDLNLLRSPKYPDWEADQGRHLFTYSLLPHAGSLDDSSVRAEAAMLNREPATVPGAASGEVRPPCALESRDITLEVVKKAEKSDDIILRLSANCCRRASGVLTLSPEFTRVEETNLIEWEKIRELPVQDGKVNLEMSPYEILTLRLKRS